MEDKRLREAEGRIKKVIDKIRPALQRDGGDIKFVSFDGDTVKVSLRGACVGCPMATFTMRNTVEKIIIHEVPEVKRVVSV